MRSIIESLNRPWQLMNLSTGEVRTVEGCTAESALINLGASIPGYLDENELFVGDLTIALGDWCALQSSPILSDIFAK